MKKVRSSIALLARKREKARLARLHIRKSHVSEITETAESTSSIRKVARPTKHKQPESLELILRASGHKDQPEAFSRGNSKIVVNIPPVFSIIRNPEDSLRAIVSVAKSAIAGKNF